MNRAAAGALVALALTAGVALRTARLAERPMHHDEANQAVKFGALLEQGEYRYDARDHHGPTLYYLTLPSAWLHGQHTLALLDEATLRGVPMVFGAATILLLPLLAAGIGRTAVVIAAMLMALSPAMVFYADVHPGGAVRLLRARLRDWRRTRRHRRRPRVGGDDWRGGRARDGDERDRGDCCAVRRRGRRDCVVVGRSRAAAERAHRQALAEGDLVGLAAAAGVAALFYSSFLTAPAAMLEPFRAAGTYLDRGIDPSSHIQPWHYYLQLLTYSASGGLRWSEGLVLALAVVGTIAAWRRSDGSSSSSSFWPRYLAGYVVIAGGIFPAIPYKTPWNLLPFYAGAFALAGVGFAALVSKNRSPLVRVLLAGALAAGSVHLGWQAWRASITYAADPRNPYVYAQTVPDAVRMAARIRHLSALHPDGARMQVSVLAPRPNSGRCRGTSGACRTSATGPLRRVLAQRHR